MAGPSLTEMQMQLEIQFADALTAAYDVGDIEMVEELEQAMRESGLGVADPDSPEGQQAIRDMADKLTACGLESEELQAVNMQLAAMTPDYRKADPVPGREMMASADDQAELNARENLPPAPGISSIC